MEARLGHRAALDAAIEAATSLRDKRELEAALQARGVPAGSVLSAPEYLADPHLNARGYFVELAHPEAGTNTWDGTPVMFNGSRGYEAWLPAPCLGEHASELLASLLGLTESDIQGLFDSHVLADTPPARVPAL
jgi:crotonobetainyl-CoA:carnitine CoA-transferase CaiB-like acyl-CoA transferase